MVRDTAGQEKSGDVRDNCSKDQHAVAMFDLTLKIPNKDVSNYKRDLVCAICKKKKKS